MVGYAFIAFLLLCGLCAPWVACLLDTELDYDPDVHN